MAGAWSGEEDMRFDSEVEPHVQRDRATVQGNAMLAIERARDLLQRCRSQITAEEQVDLNSWISSLFFAVESGELEAMEHQTGTLEAELDRCSAMLAERARDLGSLRRRLLERVKSGEALLAAAQVRLPSMETLHLQTLLADSRIIAGSEHAVLIANAEEVLTDECNRLTQLLRQDEFSSEPEWRELTPRATGRPRRSLAVLGLVLALVIALGYSFILSGVGVDQGNLTLEQVVAMVQPAVVYIEVPHTNGRTYAKGSGFVIDEDGIIITNQHVIDDGTEIKVELNDGRSFVASVLRSDAPKDIAVLKINCGGLPVVEMGNSDRVVKRQRVVAIGNPGDVRNQVTEGEITVRRLKHEGQHYIVASVVTDHGSSGGVLLNYNGQVIGITSAGAEVDGEKVTLAVPINTVKAFLP